MAELLQLRAHRSEIPSARQFNFPELTPFPELQEAFDEHRRLKAQLGDVYGDFAKLQEERVKAVARDRKAVGEALRHGTKEPSSSEVDKIDDTLVQLARREEGLDIALAAVVDEILSMIRESGTKWFPDLDRKVARQREVYRKAVDTAESARNQLMELLGLQVWMHRFPEQKNFAPAARPLRSVVRQDDQAEATRVFDALREDAEPPKAARSHGIPPLEQVWPGQGAPGIGSS